ncbi:MAG: PorV/PorQ family protein [Bacteroidetes bacterium]|nr:PorV/PorQ family protein [Bacteroidota bacterium]
MKKTVVIFLFFIQSFSFAQRVSLYGQLNTITTAVPFLLITPDARAGAMGDAGCASTPDAWSNHWNASKNAFIKKDFGAAVSYTPWLRALVPDINMADIGLYKKIKKNSAFGIFTKYFSWRDVSVPAIGQFRAHEETSGVSFSTLLSKKISGGGVLKYIYSNVSLSGNPAWSVAADMSCYWTDTIMLKDISSKFSWGINLSNIGSKIAYNNTGNREFLPQNLRAGVSYKVDIDKQNSVEVVCDANRLLVPFPVINTLPEQFQTVNIGSGIEYWHAQMFAVRSGFFYERPEYGGRKYFTLGLGVRYSVFSLDFAYLIPTEQRHPLQNTLRFTLSFDFNSLKKAEKKNMQSYFIEG